MDNGDFVDSYEHAYNSGGVLALASALCGFMAGLAVMGLVWWAW